MKKENSYPEYTWGRINEDARIVSCMEKLGGIKIEPPKNTGFKAKITGENNE